MDFYLRTKFVNILNLLFCILVLVLTWYFSKEHDKAISNYEQMKLQNEKLINEKTKITQKFEEYEQFFNTFDVATFFTYTYDQNQYKFSKGVENLFGYKQKDFNLDKDLLKHLIRKEDVYKFEEAQRKLMIGKGVEEELRILHPEQGERWVFFKAIPFNNKEGSVLKINGQFEDITKQKELEFELKRLAFFDDLTDIPNRKMLDRQVQKALSRSKRHHHNFTLMFIDLDDFKKVNDTLGHDAGDHLLKEVVSRINCCIREEDLISRIGGDEFIVMFEETGKDEIEQIAERIIEYVAQPYEINENNASISLSIGISMFPDDGEDKDALIKAADKAMYYAKSNGKNNYKLYTNELNDMEVKDKSIFKKWMEVLHIPFI
ncbi:diguanylate cyclase [Lysinibacillus composti]|uniref:Diguanylate cyclase n=2 Tax=Lysinibacillus composti TaxID=720633 RepID=A0A3N9UCW3_9BACI|nr:diguanylate cyclase [Lysinibacillus composti]